MTEWSIQQVARISEVTSRTLRHYDHVGLLSPSRLGSNGMRYYDDTGLRRLQRILLLRELGLGVVAVGEILAGDVDDVTALNQHRNWLQAEQRRLARQATSIERTIARIEDGRPLVAEEMFDGFDHRKYQHEAEERWGKKAWEQGDRWWTQLSDSERDDFGRTHREIAAEYAAARTAGLEPDHPQVQQTVERHYEWVATGWQGRRPSAEQFTGLGEMYVADDRFAANYGGPEGAQFVRAAMTAFAAQRL